jgi:hypothetical protein
MKYLLNARDLTVLHTSLICLQGTRPFWKPKNKAML